MWLYGLIPYFLIGFEAGRRVGYLAHLEDPYDPGFSITLGVFTFLLWPIVAFIWLISLIPKGFWKRILTTPSLPEYLRQRSAAKRQRKEELKEQGLI